MLYWYDVLYRGEYFLELCEIDKTRWFVWFVWFELHKWNLEVGWGELCCENECDIQIELVFR